MATATEHRFQQGRLMAGMRTVAFAVGATMLFGLACPHRLHAAGGQSVQAADNAANAVAQTAGASPVLVELFTSEGCSSCPPADAWLQRVDASQPIPGVRLIVLSEHVDYWNHDGWKDPYSSPLLTSRQENYVTALRLSTPYTPQIIIDGAEELPSGDPQQAGHTFQKAAAAPKVAVRIASVSVEAKTPAVVRARIEADGKSVKHRADVYVVVAFDHAESQVLRGENKGRHLSHVAVVQDLVKVGTLEQGKSFSRDCELTLKTGTGPANIRVIAFVQESGPGRVLGAALRNADK
jgi:hypothetical protein